MRQIFCQTLWIALLLFFSVQQEEISTIISCSFCTTQPSSYCKEIHSCLLHDRLSSTQTQTTSVCKTAYTISFFDCYLPSCWMGLLKLWVMLRSWGLYYDESMHTTIKCIYLLIAYEDLLFGYFIHAKWSIYKLKRAFQST